MSQTLARLREQKQEIEELLFLAPDEGTEHALSRRLKQVETEIATLEEDSE